MIFRLDCRFARISSVLVVSFGSSSLVGVVLAAAACFRTRLPARSTHAAPPGPNGLPAAPGGARTAPRGWTRAGLARPPPLAGTGGSTTAPLPCLRCQRPAGGESATPGFPGTLRRGYFAPGRAAVLDTRPLRWSVWEKELLADLARTMLASSAVAAARHRTRHIYVLYLCIACTTVWSRRILRAVSYVVMR